MIINWLLRLFNFIKLVIPISHSLFSFPNTNIKSKIEVVVPSSIHELPNELLEKIFGFVNDNAKLRLVCKSWNNATGGDITRFAYYEDCVMQFASDLLACPGLGPKIKCLRVEELNRHRSSLPSNLFMDEILPLCPSLVELVLDVDPYESIYVERLSKLDSHTNLLCLNYKDWIYADYINTNTIKRIMWNSSKNCANP